MEYHLKSTRDGELTEQKVGLPIVRYTLSTVQFHGDLKNVYPLLEKVTGLHS